MKVCNKERQLCFHLVRVWMSDSALPHFKYIVGFYQFVCVHVFQLVADVALQRFLDELEAASVQE